MAYALELCTNKYKQCPMSAAYTKTKTILLNVSLF